MSPGTRFVRLLLLAGAVAGAGCAQPVAPLYGWDTFPRQQYDTLLSPGAAPVAQIGPMEAHAERASAKGVALPPGFRAHLGLLKLSAGDADAARQLWLAEKAAFPEATPYMDMLLKRLDPASSARKDTPT